MSAFFMMWALHFCCLWDHSENMSTGTPNIGIGLVAIKPILEVFYEGSATGVFLPVDVHKIICHNIWYQKQRLLIRWEHCVHVAVILCFQPSTFWGEKNPAGLEINHWMQQWLDERSINHFCWKQNSKEVFDFSVETVVMIIITSSGWDNKTATITTKVIY